jgi:hypothetical protein
MLDKALDKILIDLTLHGLGPLVGMWGVSIHLLSRFLESLFDGDGLSTGYSQLNSVPLDLGSQV